MKVVGELFASGDMQLPFVLQSAETMKTAVAFLEPHMEKADAGGKGRVVIGTVKGDVHDIGKNLVDIILTNNGYEVHNLGIKVPLTEFVDKATELEADAIGMSGLLVKSTIIMRENLEELNDRGLDRIPVLLGGAALTRNYVERDLREVYKGRVFYGKDAFEGLRTMDTLIEGKRTGHARPGLRAGARGPGAPAAQVAARAGGEPADVPARSDVAADVPVFEPPFLGARVAKGISIDDIASYINETALFRNQWQFRPEKRDGGRRDRRRVQGPDPARCCATSSTGPRPRVCSCPAVAWGYFPVNSDGDDLVVWTDDDRTAERLRFHFPRQQKDRYLCIADFFRSVDVGRQGLRRLPRRHHRRRGQRTRAGAVRRRQVPGLPPAPRAVGRDGRGARRAVAPPHPRGVGLRRRGRPDAGRAVPPAVPRVRATRGATRRAPTSRTRPRWRSCSTSSASA